MSISGKVWSGAISVFLAFAAVVALNTQVTGQPIPPPSGGGGGSLAITSNGTPVSGSPATTANTVPGTGVTCTPTVSSSIWSQQCNADMAYLATQLGINAVNAQTGTTYPIAASDKSKLVTFANAGSVAVTLPHGTGSFAAPFAFGVTNIGPGTVTITPTTSTINGAASLVLTTGQSYGIITDPVGNYQLYGGASGPATFSAITSSTNTQAAMVVGSGASIAVSGTGTNSATALNGTALSGLATGSLCNTTGTGVPSICTSISVNGPITSGSGSGVAGAFDLAQGSLPSLATTAVTFIAPTAVTSYGLLYPGIAPSVNQILLWGAPASGVSTGVFTTCSTTATSSTIMCRDGSGSTAVNALNVNTISGSGIINAGSTGFFQTNITGHPQLVINSTGANYGQIYNSGSSWFLGYGSSSTTNGTGNFQWDQSGNVYFPQIPSATGVRFLCISSTGLISSSAAACVGT